MPSDFCWQRNRKQIAKKQKKKKKQSKAFCLFSAVTDK